MNIIIGLLYLLFIIILALLGTLFIMLLIYILLNFTYKFFVTSRQSGNPPYYQGNKGTPECDTTPETHKVADFACGFFYFWSPFKKLEIWAEKLASRKYVVQNGNNPSKNSSNECTLYNTPQISSKKSIESMRYEAIMGMSSHADKSTIGENHESTKRASNPEEHLVSLIYGKMRGIILNTKPESARHKAIRREVYA
jgi:hypothetical protein